MTVRVTVKTHAVGASLTINGESSRVEPRSETTFYVSSSTQFDLVEDEPSADPTPVEGEGTHLPLDPNDVPGRAENDALLSKFDHDGDGKPGGSPKGGLKK